MVEINNDLPSDQDLYLLESDTLGYLPGFEPGTKRAMVTGLEAAAVALKVTSGLHNFRVDSPYYYSKWAGEDEREIARRYHEEMARQRTSNQGL